MIDLGLSRITHLVKRLSTPTWTAIHIAGTNGKGSVAAYLSSLFLRLSRSKSGELRIGRFTSPHLIDRWDCITINDRPVSESLFLSVEERIKSTIITEIKPQLANAGGQVTEFELLTVTAFEIFSQQKCQLAVIECGLGGRLDATNVLEADNVAVSVITKIGLDHQGFLGNTIEDIAREKIGIAKPQVPVVVDGSNLESVQQVISRSAKKAGAGELVLTAASTSQLSSLDLPLHQKQNLSLALTAYELATGRIPGLAIEPASESIIPQVISDVNKSYPGRLQHLSIAKLIPRYEKEILLDGAHNAQSANVLRQYVDNNLSVKPKGIVWVLAMSQGKDILDILQILLRREDRVVTCGFGSVDGMPWVKSVNASKLSKEATMIVEEAETCDDVVDALRKASHLSHQLNTCIVVAGSLYLISDVFRALRKANEDI